MVLLAVREDALMAVLRMSTGELSRVETLMHVVSGRMTVTEAARLMSVSRRHAHRLLTRSRLPQSFALPDSINRW
jgi:predicted DNA-binding protein (UPF0251 family)